MNDMPSTYPAYFTAADEPETTTIGTASYLSLTGDGRPGTDAFYASKAALTHAATRLGISGPVEILYWYGSEHGEIDITSFYSTAPLDALHYRMLIRVPDDVAATEIPDEVRIAAGGHGPDLAFFTMTEGDVVQVMHHVIHLDPFGPGSSQEDLRTILRDPVA